MEIAQTIDNALEEYYSEQGKPVPKWRTKKDPDWWMEYLIRLGIDPKTHDTCTIFTIFLRPICDRNFVLWNQGWIL